MGFCQKVVIVFINEGEREYFVLLLGWISNFLFAYYSIDT